MIPAQILPPRPARRARSPRVAPFVPGVEAPARSRRPELPPPPLEALEMDAEWLAFCDAERDEAEWMHLPVGGVALGIGEVVDGQLVWRPWPVGRA